jgi:hypothetical protein
MWRLGLAALAVASALGGAVRASGDTRYPVFYASPDDPATGIPATLSFRAAHLAVAARTRRITIAIPAAYAVDPRALTGRAEVRRARRIGGRATLYTGRIVAAGRAWEVQVRSKAGAELRLPLTLTPRSLTLSVPPNAGILSGFDLAIHRVFRNPKLPRKYLFTARVLTGGGAYELRCYENLAARLSLRASYSKATRWFTVTGAIEHDPRARSGSTVFIYVAQSREPAAYKSLAVVQTSRGGRFTYRTRIVPPPLSVFAYADSTYRRGQTYDTITSPAYPIRQSR